LAEIVDESLLESSELLVPPVPDVPLAPFVPLADPSIGDAAAPFNACPAVNA
jgi:hypothetical protein